MRRWQLFPLLTRTSATMIQASTLSQLSTTSIPFSNEDREVIDVRFISKNNFGQELHRRCRSEKPNSRQREKDDQPTGSDDERVSSLRADSLPPRACLDAEPTISYLFLLSSKRRRRWLHTPNSIGHGLRIFEWQVSRVHREN